MYDEESDVITSSVILDGENKKIIITEHLICEVLNFPDDENSPTSFQERMVKGCMLRMGYSKTWIYPRFVQMMLDNGLLVLHHMDNETLIILSRYHKNWPEPKTKAEFFGFVKSANYKDLDPVNHLKWRDDEEMKEKSAADELSKLAEFKETRSEWFTKEEKKKRSRKTTPKAQDEEGSSSQLQKKRKKKVVETMLVDEPEEVEAEANVEGNQEQLSPGMEQLMKYIDVTLETGEAACEKVGDDKEKSSFDPEESDIDAVADRWIKENFDPRERLIKKKRKRSADDDDDEAYIPSPEDF
ncbi:hypothetical protein Hanom_Chr16g01456341 [Helianthus anomalus]